MKNILFICSMNRLRSPTAETIFSELAHISVDSAGLNRGADIILSAEQLESADIIFVMEKTHLRKLNQKYNQHLKGKRIITLNIPDNYPYMDPDLIKILQKKCQPYL
ncbi:MAG: low molecular weight protein tyrosine phosphatase family protein [Akkermansiaceae bacterium]